LFTSRIPDNWPPFVNVAQVGAVLCVSDGIVRRMAGKALPRPVRLTQRTLLFDAAAVREALARLEGGAA
jgi:hypothetical protein